VCLTRQKLEVLSGEKHASGFTARAGHAPLAAEPPAAAPPALLPLSPPAPPSAPERDGMTCRLRRNQQRFTACCTLSAPHGQQGCAAGAAP